MKLWDNMLVPFVILLEGGGMMRVIHNFREQ